MTTPQSKDVCVGLPGSPAQRWQGSALVAAVLVVSTMAMLLTYAHVLRTDPSKLAGKYDIYRYFGPSNYYMDCRLHDGELPLWNPMLFCGIPHAANPQAFVFYPPNLVRSLLNVDPSPYSTQAGWVIMLGLHLIFMSVCTFLFGRAHGLSVPASLVAAVSFTFSALMVRRACEYHMITTGAWTPLLLLMIKKVLDAPGFRNKLVWALAGGVCLGFSILGGFLQFANNMGVLLGMYAVLYRLSYPKGVEGQENTRVARLWGLDVAGMALFFVLGGLVAAVMLVPAGESAALTSRMQGMKVPMYSNLWQWTGERFYQSFIVYTGMKYEAETIRNSGVGVLLLAAGAFFYSRKRLTMIFLLLYLILLDCCFGPPLPFSTLVSWLTPFSMSAYTRGYDFALFPLSMLAGLGVDAVMVSQGKAWRAMGRTLWLAAAALATLPMLAKWLNIYTMLPVSPWVVYLPALVFVLMFLLTWTPFPKRVAVTLALLFPVLVFSETYAWNKHFVPNLVAKRVRDTRPVSGGQAIPQDNTKEADPIANRYLYSMRRSMNGMDPMFLQTMRDFLSGGQPAKEYHRLVKDWETTRENQRGNLFLKRCFWLAKTWARGEQPGKSAQYPPTTTVFIKEPAGLPLADIPEVQALSTPFSDKTVQTAIAGVETRFRPVHAGTKGSFSLAFQLPKTVEGRNPGPAGAAHTVLCYEYSGTCGAKVSTEITEPATGRRQWCPDMRVAAAQGQDRRVYVPLPDFPEVKADITVEASKGAGEFEIKNAFLITDQNDEDGLIRIVKLRANTMDIEVGPLDSPRILLHTDAVYPGWSAYVDGVETPIFAANDLFKAIVVPAGTHQVRFAYRPHSFYTGAAVSVLSLIAGILGAFHIWRAKGNPRAS